MTDLGVLQSEGSACANTQILKSQRTRTAILDAAISLFANQGYAATSMRQIAESAGLALGGIYNHFLSKEAIFQSVLNERQPCRHFLPSFPSSSIDRLAIKDLLNELDRQPEFFNLLLIEILEFKGQHLPALMDSVWLETPPPLSYHALISMVVSHQISRRLLNGSSPTGRQSLATDKYIDIFLNNISILE